MANAGVLQNQINTTNANIGSFYTYANATYATQTALSNFETYANATFSTGGSSYGNTNVAAYLTTATISTTGNITGANLTTTGNLTASYVKGNGSLLTNLPTQAGTYSNANVASYLPVYSGDVGNTGTPAGTGYFNTVSATTLSGALSGSQTGITAIAGYTEGGGVVEIQDTSTVYIHSPITVLGDTSYTQLTGINGYLNIVGNATFGPYAGNAIVVNNGNVQVNPGYYYLGNGSKLTNLPVQAGTYTNSNVTNLLSGGTYSGDINAPTGVVTAAAINSTGAITASSYVQAAQGLYSIGTFSGTYSDGIVVDYVTGNGRISVGTADNVTFYTGGVSATPTLQIAANGAAVAGNLITTNGVYWSNGAAYSTGSSFTGNLAGQTLYDGSNNYIIANAYPFSPISTSVGSSYQQLYFRNPKGVYVNGILQNNSTTNGYIINSAQQANIALRTGSGTQQTVFGSTNYMQVWPANVTMNNNDRYRGAGFVSEVNLNGATWGTMSSASATAPTLVGFNSIASVLGNGNANHVIANYSAPYIVPANGSANVQYATVLYGAIQFGANAANNYTASNIAYARLVAGSLSLSGNLTVQNAIGLHTVNGWAGTAFSSLVTNQRYAVLNEDASTIIQTNGNIVVTTPAAATTGFNSAGVFTVTQLNAVTGVVGQIAAVSNGSAKNGGQFAYWDTTNARWSWFDTNLAVS